MMSINWFRLVEIEFIKIYEFNALESNNNILIDSILSYMISSYYLPLVRWIEIRNYTDFKLLSIHH